MKSFRWLRKCLFTLVGTLLLGSIALTLVYRACRRFNSSENPTHGSSRLLNTECRIGHDEFGIARVHVSAKGKGQDDSREEQRFLACLGFVHALDRSWQMDFLRKIARGRKSELTGFEGIESDFLMRLLGLSERAEALSEKLSPDLRERFDAYSWGVNQGFRRVFNKGPLPYEFRRLEARPETWRTSDTLSLILLQSFNQTRRGMEQEFKEERWRAAFGAEAQELSAEKGLPWETTVIHTQEISSTPTPDPLPRAPSGTTLPPPKDVPGFKKEQESLRGSNNWVIAPSRSRTRKAWLANDPHLDLRHPPFWHWTQIKDGSRDVLAGSLPGTPVFASGLNSRVAWGLTNAYMDVMDVVHVEEAELKEDAKTFRPLIWFRLGYFQLPFFFKSFRRTSSGLPVVPRESPPGLAKVIRWTGYQLSSEDLRGLFELGISQTSRDTDRALSRARIPTWNFVFADIHGTIGYRTVGLVPSRHSPPHFGIERLPIAEINKPYDVLGSGDMPHLLAPARGYIATANNRQWPSGARFHPGRATTTPFRAFRIEEMLKETSRHGFDSIRAIQCDVQSVDARFLLPLLIASLGRNEELSAPERHSISLLKEWGERLDFQAKLDCEACPLYRRWIQRIFETTAYDEASLYRALQGIPKETTLFVRDAFRQARLDVGTSTWGSLHRSFFSHLLPSLARPDSISTPGDKHSVSPGNPQWKTNRSTQVGNARGIFEQDGGASHRLVVELSNPPRVFLNLTGSNLDVENPHLNATDGPWMRYVNCVTPEIKLDSPGLNPQTYVLD